VRDGVPGMLGVLGVLKVRAGSPECLVADLGES
jgi:hypothetical protein